jgi:amino acid transporter
MNNFHQRNSTTWRDMSVDFKLMFVYHGAMMVMFMAGQGGLSVRSELQFTTLLVVILVAIAIRHRKKANWRWPGVKPGNVLGAAAGLALIGFFLFAATPLFPPTSGAALPWYLAGLGIGSFGVLSSLRITYGSEADFLMQCHIVDPTGREIARVSELKPKTPAEPRWKKIARVGYVVVFMLIWIDGVASFYSFGEAFKDGSPVPTATCTEPINNHGKIVYITSAEKDRVDRLQKVSWVGIPSVMVGALVLHFLVGVKLFPNAPTLAEYMNQRKKPL